MKIAILHEMFVKLGGAEKVVESFLEAFPGADLFTLIYDETKVGKVFPRKIINNQVFGLKTQKVYQIFGKQRLCFPFMSSSVESLDFSHYDIVLCSSSGFAHGAITKPETKFIVYYHSPSRYLWDYTNEYQNSLGLNSGFKKYLKFLFDRLFLLNRIWDYIASSRVDLPIAASKHVGKRIKKYYRRIDFDVIYPPVNLDQFINFDKKLIKKDYYVTVAALTEWKRLDILINSFNKMPEKKLKIIGIGDYENKYSQMIKSKNIELVGYKSGKKLISLLGQAKGFVFSSCDDFGIAPVESLACGTPVFGLASGGLLETNVSGVTGDFFYDVDGADFIEKFLIFEKNIDSGLYKYSDLINHSEKFSKEIFIDNIKNLVYKKCGIFFDKNLFFYIIILVYNKIIFNMSICNTDSNKFDIILSEIKESNKRFEEQNAKYDKRFEEQINTIKNLTDELCIKADRLDDTISELRDKVAQIGGYQSDELIYYTREYNVSNVQLSLDDNNNFAKLLKIKYDPETDSFVPRDIKQLKAISNFFISLGMNAKQKYNYLVKNCGTIEKGLLLLEKLEGSFDKYKEQMQFLS